MSVQKDDAASETTAKRRVEAAEDILCGKIDKPRVRRTPNGRHHYTATLKGYPTHGWGNTPDEARAKLAENIERFAVKPAIGKFAVVRP